MEHEVVRRVAGGVNSSAWDSTIEEWEILIRSDLFGASWDAFTLATNDLESRVGLSPPLVMSSMIPMFVSGQDGSGWLSLRDPVEIKDGVDHLKVSRIHKEVLFGRLVYQDVRQVVL